MSDDFVKTMPTVADLRKAARVNRWMARLLTKAQNERPIWKRIFTEFPVKTLNEHAGRFESMADQIEAGRYQ